MQQRINMAIAILSYADREDGGIISALYEARANPQNTVLKAVIFKYREDSKRYRANPKLQEDADFADAMLCILCPFDPSCRCGA